MNVYPKETGGVIICDLDTLPTCTLRKMRSDDGKWEFIEGKAFVGKSYKYAEKSRQVASIIHTPTGEEFQCEIVLVYDERGFFGMMPTECLCFP